MQAQVRFALPQLEEDDRAATGRGRLGLEQLQAALM